MVENRRHRWLQVLLMAGAFSGGVGSLGCDRIFHRASVSAGYQGIVEHETRVLGFEVGGRIESMLVHRGGQVKQGDVLAKLDDRLEQAALRAQASQARAQEQELELVRLGARVEDITAAKARLEASRAAEEVLEQARARNQKLVSAGALAPSVLEQTEASLAQAKGDRRANQQALNALIKGSRPEEVARAVALSEASERQVALTRERLERYSLRAPISGQVMELYAENGEVVGPMVRVIALANLDRPFVEVFVPQDHIGAVKLGQKVKVRVDAHAEPFSGEVEYVSRQLEFTPRFVFSDRERPNLVLRVRVRISDPSHRLHAGIPAFVTVFGGGDS